MSQRKKKANRQRQEEEVSGIPNWSELCPDLLRCVFKRLSFISLNRAKSVCSLWYSPSRGCVPKPNQIPCLILFPCKKKGNNNSGTCVLFIPEDKENVYKTRDLGVDFVRSCCLAIYGSWLLMIDKSLCNNLFILNPLTRVRIDLPYTKSPVSQHLIYSIKTCFWIDNRTKDYLVVCRTRGHTMFTKKGVNKWHEFPQLQWREEIFYNHKNQKLYIYYRNGSVKIWDFSGDKPIEDGVLDCSWLKHYDLLHWKSFAEINRRLAVTISGDVLMVACCRMPHYKTWYFRIYKANQVNRNWVRIDSLGDEALILDMGVTVVAKGIPGIKRNSIYFSGFGRGRNDPNNLFFYSLTTQKIESLPKCVFSSIQGFSHAQWFFPGFNG